MKRSDLEIILLKHGASEDLRKDLLMWAFDSSDPNATQTFHAASKRNVNDENVDQTFVLGQNPNADQVKADSRFTPDSTQKVLRPKPESVNLKEYEDVLINAKLYIDDAENFLKEGKKEYAVLSIGYADGLVDALRIAKGFDPKM